MQLSKEEYARKRVHNDSSVQIENSVTRVTVQHHLASLVMLNNYPCDGIFNKHLSTIKDSYILNLPVMWDLSQTINRYLKTYLRLSLWLRGIQSIVKLLNIHT